MGLPAGEWDGSSEVQEGPERRRLGCVDGPVYILMVRQKGEEQRGVHAIQRVSACCGQGGADDGRAMASDAVTSRLSTYFLGALGAAERGGADG
jgi:hypothetical protein